MSLLGRRTPTAAAVEAAPGEAYRCDSCGTTGQPLITEGIPGGEVRMCANPAACRMRAQAAGTWCDYEPAGGGR